MACNHNLHLSLSHKLRSSFKSLCNSPISPCHPVRLAFLSRSSIQRPVRFRHCSVRASSGFTWDDAIRISQPEYAPSDSSDLTGYFEKIKFCNQNSELQSEFIPFVIENQIIGYIHNSFSDLLKRFQDVFTFPQENSYGSNFAGHVTLHPMLKTPEDRTAAVGDVIKTLGEEAVPGIRNELFPVSSSFGSPIFFSLERAAAPYFGIKVYGVQMNGYVEREGQKFLWIGKRSPAKSTYPGMLDHLVAGGLPHGIACGENLIKECEEEAGIPRSIAKEAISVGAVSYMDIDGFRFKRDVLFCYDLKLPEDFIPKNLDGEVESFKLMPVTHVANVIRRTQFFKANCTLVIIDFLLRHGYKTLPLYSYSSLFPLFDMSCFISLLCSLVIKHKQLSPKAIKLELFFVSLPNTSHD